MDRELKRYRRKGNVPVIRFDRPTVDVTITSRQLSNSETAYVFARNAFDLGAYAAAAEYLDDRED